MTFVSRSPERAARYANAVAEAFVASQSQVHTEATDEAASFLNSRLKTLSDRLRASELALQASIGQARTALVTAKEVSPTMPELIARETAAAVPSPPDRPSSSRRPSPRCAWHGHGLPQVQRVV